MTAFSQLRRENREKIAAMTDRSGVRSAQCTSHVGSLIKFLLNNGELKDASSL